MAAKPHAHFPASLEDLHRMLLWIRNRLTDAGMDAAMIRQVELASEEAIANIIHHAYQDRGGEIELLFASQPGGVEISIVDHGPPFDPLEDAPLPDLSSPLDKRKEGELGLFLMRKCLDDIRYRREEGSNVLTLVKHFSRRT